MAWPVGTSGRGATIMRFFLFFLIGLPMIGSALAASSALTSDYIPGTRLEGDSALFGQWEFKITSLTRDEESIHPLTRKISMCLIQGMDEEALPLRAIPRVGRCIIHSNHFLADSIMINFTCDEGEKVSGSIGIDMSRQDDGSYEGELNYVASPDDADYQINARADIRAQRIGECEASQ